MSLLYELGSEQKECKEFARDQRAKMYIVKAEFKPSSDPSLYVALYLDLMLLYSL